jgi:hypothetical protein
LRTAQLQILPQATNANIRTNLRPITNSSAGFEDSEWHARLQRERASIAASALRANLNRIVDRIFAAW